MKNPADNATVDLPLATFREGANALIDAPIETIVTDPQIRTRNGFDDSLQDLAKSIQRNGLLQPLLVRLNPDGSNTFLVIAGHRRLAALKIAGYSHAAVIVARGADAERGFEAQLAENIQREQLTLADTADAVRMLQRLHDKPSEIAAIVNKSAAWVSKHLALTDSRFSPEVRALLDDGHCDDLESLHGLNQIAKHKDGAKALASLIATIKKDGAVSRSAVRNMLARLKAPRDLEVESVAHASGPAERVYKVTIDPNYVEAFEDLGGREWLNAQLEKHFQSMES